MELETVRTKRVFLDRYGIWPGQAGVDEGGRAWLQDPPQGVGLSVQQAGLSDVLIHAERPWEAGEVSPFCVIREDRVLRLWYYASPACEGAATYVAYAEGVDGFHWNRPELGIVPFEGSRANNLLLATETFAMHSVFVDPSARAEERYKAIAPGAVFYHKGIPDLDMKKPEFKEIRRKLIEEGIAPEVVNEEFYFHSLVRGAVSPDGLHWRILEEPLLDVGRTQLDTQNVATFDPEAREYRGYLRGHLERRRLVRVTSGKDFRAWGPTRPIFGADAQDPIDDDVYSPCYCRVPGGGHHLLFPSIYHRLESTVDLAIATSRDGLFWTRPERKPILDRRAFGQECSMVFAMPNLVPLDEDRWGLMVQGQFRRHDGGAETAAHPEWRWAIWGADRLVALEAPVQGKVTLVEQTASGKELLANYATAKGGWLKVELVQTPSTPASPVEAFEGFGLADADPLVGDERAGVATWRGRSDLSPLAGRKVSVRITMSRAKLFSISY